LLAASRPPLSDHFRWTAPPTLASLLDESQDAPDKAIIPASPVCSGGFAAVADGSRQGAAAGKVAGTLLSTASRPPPSDAFVRRGMACPHAGLPLAEKARTPRSTDNRGLPRRVPKPGSPFRWRQKNGRSGSVRRTPGHLAKLSALSGRQRGAQSGLGRLASRHSHRHQVEGELTVPDTPRARADRLNALRIRIGARRWRLFSQVCQLMLARGLHHFKLKTNQLVISQHCLLTANSWLFPNAVGYQQTTTQTARCPRR
jgi:hypothetical protein